MIIFWKKMIMRPGCGGPAIRGGEQQNLSAVVASWDGTTVERLCCSQGCSRTALL
jgi:hypothetical protein